jgi:hypothetical protein
MGSCCLRADRDRVSLPPSGDGASDGSEDGVLWDRSAFARHHTGLHRSAVARRTVWSPSYPRALFCRHDGHNRIGVRLGVLLADGLGAASFPDSAFFPRSFWRHFAIFSLWLPELFSTEARGTAFAFCTSVGRFIGAGVNFGLAAAVAAMGTLGTPIALTSITFAVGLFIIPFAAETRGETLPE